MSDEGGVSGVDGGLVWMGDELRSVRDGLIFVGCYGLSQIYIILLIHVFPMLS